MKPQNQRVALSGQIGLPTSSSIRQKEFVVYENRLAFTYLTALPLQRHIAETLAGADQETISDVSIRISRYQPPGELLSHERANVLSADSEQRPRLRFSSISNLGRGHRRGEPVQLIRARNGGSKS